MRMRLSSGDVCEIAGIPLNTLDRWVSTGHVVSVAGGGRRGDHRYYGLAAAFAIFAGAKWRAEGAGPERVAGVIRCLSRLTVERLEEHLRQGETHPVPDTLVQQAAADEGLRRNLWLPGMLIKPPPESEMGPEAVALMRRLDLKPLWEQFRRRAEQVGSKPAKQRGRKPGKAGVRKRQRS